MNFTALLNKLPSTCWTRARSTRRRDCRSCTRASSWIRSLGGKWPRHLLRLIDDRAERHRLEVERQAARLNADGVEQVGDEPAHVCGRARHCAPTARAVDRA